MNIRDLLITVFAAGIASFTIAQCPVDISTISVDSVGKILNDPALQKDSGDKKCLYEIVAHFPCANKPSQDVVKNFFEQQERQQGVSNELLFAAYRNSSITGNQKLWDAIISLWKRKNKSPQIAFEHLVKIGSSAQADTLYTIFDSREELDPDDLVDWIKVKNIIGDYGKIADLTCRTIDELKEYELITLSQFSSLLAELPQEQAALVLDRFATLCDPSHFMQQNSSYVVRWFLDMWGRLGESSKQVAYVKKYLPGSDRAEIFLDIAKSYFRKKNYTGTIETASAGYNDASGEMKDACSQLLFQSYAALNKNDSALVWVGKTGKLTLDNTTVAILMYQSKGDFQTASKLLELLPRSLNRDTLTIRQYICNGEFSRAIAICHESVFLKKDPVAFQCLNMKLLLFSKDLTGFLTVLDSIRTEQQFSTIPEILRYRYWVQLFNKDMEMLAVWAVIEYNTFIGVPEKSKGLLSNGNLVNSAGYDELVLSAARATAQKSSREAVNMYNLCNKIMSKPELMYYKGEAMFSAGIRDSARTLLETIVLDYPESILSGKARLLLMQYSGQ